MKMNIQAIAHGELNASHIESLRMLFDREYFDEYGWWDPKAPYGYSPAAVHVMASDGERLLGHVGFEPRNITVGDQDLIVAGTGGVLVADEARGLGLDGLLMRQAREEMREIPGVDFGYLGCRPAVVPFYESSGWQRIRARERHLARLEPSRIVESDDSNILICAVARSVEEWPAGTIDLRGGAW